MEALGGINVSFFILQEQVVQSMYVRLWAVQLVYTLCQEFSVP